MAEPRARIIPDTAQPCLWCGIVVESVNQWANEPCDNPPMGMARRHEVADWPMLPHPGWSGISAK